MSLATRLRAAQTALPAWNTYVASLSPWAWWKLDEALGVTTIADASGNGRTGTYPNGGVAGFPTRATTALVTGSTNGILLGGGGNLELRMATVTATALLNGGSWTFGFFIRSTETARNALWIKNSAGAGNFLFVDMNGNNAGSTVSGGIMLHYSTSGANAAGLETGNIGWNDGSDHLLMFEYNATAGTITIYKDGSVAATRSMATGAPTMATNFDVLGSMTPRLDEWLFFNRVLTATEHANLATYR